ncbi:MULTISPECIES: hypothetical protein [unclassified Bartonella]|uniref:hypothetical protein n=1 Tax=unclassified Bartonella TaxID=2645622 RepID=UPI0035CF7F19
MNKNLAKKNSQKASYESLNARAVMILKAGKKYSVNLHLILKSKSLYTSKVIQKIIHYFPHGGEIVQ